MSKTKRLEKEIDYLKGIIGILVFLIAGLVAWFVNTDDETNVYFKLIAIVLFSFFVLGIIKTDTKIYKLLDELEIENDK
jgi:uncharacterized membrane protein